MGNILSMLFIGAMSWQDFRSRSITAWLLPASGLCFLLGEISVLTSDQLLRNVKVNYMLLGLQFSVLWLWICFRERRFFNIINSHVGLGDIVLLLCLAPAFSPFNFFLFYTAGAIAAIVAQMFILINNKNAEKRIPLAGVLGLPLMLVCIVRLIEPKLITLISDDWLLSMLPI